MASYEDSLDYLNQDFLQIEKSFSFSFGDLLTREFWQENISDRFYNSVNFALPIFLILILYMGFFVGYAYPNYHKYGEFRSNHLFMALLFGFIFLVTVLGRGGLSEIFSERGLKLIEIQNSKLLKDNGVYDNFLFRWRWSLLFFFLTLCSFTFPILFIPLISAYLYRFKSQDKNENKQTRVDKKGFKIL
jgi:hypothetical protein